MRTVRFITRRNCSICDGALPLVSGRVDRKGWKLEIEDADDSGLGAELGDRLPVVLLDGREVLSGRFGRRDIRRALH